MIYASQQKGGLRLASALLVVCLLSEYSISLELESVELLCNSLLLRLDPDQSTCSEFQVLMDTYIADQSEK